MKGNLDVSYYKPDRPGVFPFPGGVNLAVSHTGGEEGGILLKDAHGTVTKIPFFKEGRQGNLYGISLKGTQLEKFTYQLYDGERVYTDCYARGISGLECWGGAEGLRRETAGTLRNTPFDWQQDYAPMIPVEDSIFYGLNVRSYTMHRSSGVKHKGTFEGVAEKISYLKKLGITAVLLMPCYEYEECMLPIGTLADTGNQEYTGSRLNCWGFQQGYYFAPKASYSAAKDPEYSFKSMVREFHKNNIEVMMQIYFPQGTRQLFMLDVLKFWVREYHVDGFRLDGFDLPYRLLAEEEFLKTTKLWCAYLPDENRALMQNSGFKNFLSDNGQYRNEMRRFLKGDEGMVNPFLTYQRSNPTEYGVVNYLADYNGFSLYDSVAYERKHNEENGEGNQDGTEYNFTWNCGAEGESRKKSIRELRLKQLKNAVSLLFLCQGVPYLFGGDEFANSRGGNNNCYCQDNETGWVKWKSNQFSEELLTYVRHLILLRRSHPILHRKDAFRIMDTMGKGYPDISYHGIDAWNPDLSYLSRAVGIVLWGEYAPGEDASFYIACNMHWEAHRLALPKPNKNRKWVKIADTLQKLSHAASVGEEERQKTPMEETIIEMQPRSIAIYQTIIDTK